MKRPGSCASHMHPCTAGGATQGLLPHERGPCAPASVETAVQTARLVLRKMSPTAVLNLSQDSVHPVAGQSPGTRGAVSTSLSLRHYPYHPVWGSIESISQKGFPPSEATDLGKRGGCAETSCHAMGSGTRQSWSYCGCKERCDVGAEPKVCFQE